MQAFYHGVIANGFETTMGPADNTGAGGKYLSLRELANCQPLSQPHGISHWRCLSPFMGYPDDLILWYSCDPNEPSNTVVKMFSQSRLGLWDWGVNEFRLRLLARLKTLPFLKKPDFHDGGCA